MTLGKKIFIHSIGMIILAALVAGCSSTSATPAPTATDPGRDILQPTPVPTDAPPTPTARPVIDIARIKIRTVDGVAEFFNSGTGEKFVPRGFNYIHFLPTERDMYEDRVMAVNHYDPARVREAFRHMSSAGYNTVRIFFDICSFGAYCFAKENGEGLNPGYLDNMVDLMHIAGEEGIYIIFTANSIPEGGGYSAYFDSLFEANPAGFEDWRNADWLHAAGVETKRKIWQDMMTGLAEREAPFEIVLGWQLTNEFWYWGDVAEPFSLEEGLVTTANGQTYDMSSQFQKQQMALDGLVYFMEQIVAEIKAVDPEGLTTMGFFAPYFGYDRYIVTPELLKTTTPVDFWDFHAYFDTPLTVYEQAESFGMLGYDEKPIIMGETGAGHQFVPSAASALTKGVEWIADSCEVGFDGWLYWGYYPWPELVGGAAWAPLEEDNLIFDQMAPANQPDPCIPPTELDTYNAAYQKPVRASRTESGKLPGDAVDGSEKDWSAGNYPPQWIEIDLEQPTTINRVAMNVAQWPPGVTHHRVSARLEDGRTVLLGVINAFTTIDQILAIDLPVPLDQVRSIRITTTQSPSWVGWREVEVVAVHPAGTVCLGTVQVAAELLADPVEEANQLDILSPGTVVYLDGWYIDEDGSGWGRSGGDSWVLLDQLSLEGECESPALAAEPGIPLVPITFQVTVPEDTPGEVFMTGLFPGMGWQDWTPWMMVLNQTSRNQHEIMIPLPQNTEIEYLFTRQNWETVERTATCGRVPNRTYTVGQSEDLIAVEVEAWRDLDCGGE